MTWQKILSFIEIRKTADYHNVFINDGADDDLDGDNEGRKAGCKQSRRLKERSGDEQDGIQWLYRGFITGLDSPSAAVEESHAHMHTHRTDRGRDTEGRIQTGKNKTYKHKGEGRAAMIRS